MPYKTNQADVKPDNELRQDLKHKPVYALPYQAFDGHCNRDTDMRWITIGIAQYNEEEVSLKTFRYVGEKWTRQSEELPLHRVIDSATFLAKILFEAENGDLEIPKKTFHNQIDDLSITPEKCSYGQRATFSKFLDDQTPLLNERFNVLYNTLHALKKAGKF